MPTKEKTTSAAVADQIRKTQNSHCPFCGKMFPTGLAHCPHCRETIPEVRTFKPAAAPQEKRGQIRRGLLYMLMAAVIHYFAGGYSALDLPYPINPIVTIYLSPMLFLGGLGLSIYGFYLQTQK